MKLFFVDHSGEKRYLEYEAKTRAELKTQIGSQHFDYEGISYSIRNVQAETSSNSVFPAVLGGALGILAGGLGVAIGATIGAMAGESIVETEKKAVNEFNSSTL